MKFASSPLVPALKWAGGKRALWPQIAEHLPHVLPGHRYLEPFIGGGAVALALAPEQAVWGDSNMELINFYRQVRDDPDRVLNFVHRWPNTAELYYAIRNWDRDPQWPDTQPPVIRAARFLYINQTGYNGLWRVNRQNQCSVPWGHRTTVTWPQEAIWRMADYLDRHAIHLRHGDFAATVADAEAGDVIYCDPPYDPLSSTAHFTQYNTGGFTAKDQERLADAVWAWAARGCVVVLSNADTPRVRALYAGAAITPISAPRAIAARGAARRPAAEVIIRVDNSMARAIELDAASQRPISSPHEPGGRVYAAAMDRHSHV